MSEQLRAAVEEELRRAYGAAGLSWPGRVWWVPSPCAGELVARMAAATIGRARDREAALAPARVRRVATAVRGGIVRVLRAGVMIGAAIVGNVVLWAGGAALVALCVEHHQRTGFVAFWAGLGALVGVSRGLERWGGDRAARAEATVRAVRDRAVAGIDAGSRQVRAALFDVGPHPATGDDLLFAGIDQPVDHACGRVWTALDDGLRAAATGAEPAGQAPDTDLVRRIVDAVVGGTDPVEPVTPWPAPTAGALARTRAGSSATTVWLHHHTGERPPVADVDIDAVAALAGSGHIWWWAHPDFVVVSEPPVELHVESTAGSHRLHRADGPAVRWSDGLSLHFWHGVRVPSSLIERGWTVEGIHRHHNSEVRRAAIERMGWLTYIEQAGLSWSPRPPIPATRHTSSGSTPTRNDASARPACW